jgi:hypothetical protein
MDVEVRGEPKEFINSIRNISDINEIFEPRPLAFV